MWSHRSRRSWRRIDPCSAGRSGPMSKVCRRPTALFQYDGARDGRPGSPPSYAFGRAATVPCCTRRGVCVDFEMPKDVVEFLAKVDEFIESEIKPLEQESDN